MPVWHPPENHSPTPNRFERCDTQGARGRLGRSISSSQGGPRGHGDNLHEARVRGDPAREEDRFSSWACGAAAGRDRLIWATGIVAIPVSNASVGPSNARVVFQDQGCPDPVRREPTRGDLSLVATGAATYILSCAPA